MLLESKIKSKQTFFGGREHPKYIKYSQLFVWFLSAISTFGIEIPIKTVKEKKEKSQEVIAKNKKFD